MSSIGVIGNGFVGNAVVYAFDSEHDVKVYDTDSSKANSSFDETINQDIIFVCVPTPMIDIEGGECNLSIIENVFAEINKSIIKKDNIFVIKSTVPIGTTQKLQEKYSNITIVHSPEFLTAKNAKMDFITASRHIIGIPFNAKNSNHQKLIKLYEERFFGALILTMDSNESEFVKYSCNSFLATKVSYFNELKLLSDKLNLDWDLIMKGILSDERIGNSHTSVPGHDGDRGFGGTCFPKDINALINTMELYGIDPFILKAAWNQNKNVRSNWDWAKSKSSFMPKI